MTQASKLETYRERIIIIDFVAYDKQQTLHFFDQTVDQISQHIWRDICPTAVILYAWEYVVSNPKQMNVTKRKLTDNELKKSYKSE